MPTLPMLTPATEPNATRAVTAPGGYECWRFDAASDDGHLHLVAELHAGFAYDPAYLRAYARYRREPTRHHPPVPVEHAAVTLTVLRRGQVVVRLISRVRSDELETRGNGRIVRLGASHMNRGSDGVMRLHVRGVRKNGTVTANLAFRPLVRSDHLIPLSAPDAPAGEHGWVIVDPLCDVDGEVSIYDGAGAAPRSITFAGSGYHDHRYGTRPLHELADRWLTGRVLFEDRAVTFCRIGQQTHVCETRVGRCAAEAERLRCRGSSLTTWGLSYPDAIDVGEEVQLVRPRVIESRPAWVRVAYDALGDAQTGAALCEVVRPRRLAGPLLGRWMQWVARP